MEKTLVNANYYNLDLPDDKTKQDYLKELILSAVSYFRKKDIQRLQQEVDKRIIQYQYERKKYRDNSLFLLGRYIGTLEAFDEYLLLHNETNKPYKLMDGSKAEDIPHSDDIIRTIYLEEGIRHGKLAQKTGIDKSTLTPIMDKLVLFGLVTFEHSGKFKYYYLTPTGEEYYQKKLKTEFNLDYLIESLLIAVSSSANPTETAQKVTSAIIASQYKFKGYNSAPEKRIRPAVLISSLVDKYQDPFYIQYCGKNLKINKAEVFSIFEKGETVRDFLKLSDTNRELLENEKEA